MPLTITIVVTVLFQTLATVLSCHRRPWTGGRLIENLFEVFVLLLVFVLSLQHGQVVKNYASSIIPPTGYTNLRLGCFIGLAVLAFIIFVANKKSDYLIWAAVTGLALLEKAAGHCYPYLFGATLLSLLGRSLNILRTRSVDLRKNLSALSIKYAVDSLHTGVLFCESDGFILLLNAQMRRLMKRITGSISHNGNRFYQALTSGDHKPDCKSITFHGQIVCLLPEGSAWLFSRAVLSIKRKKYSQLTATDISQRWALIEQLQQQQTELTAKRDELNLALAQVHTLSQERETERAKMRAHAVLGQRLSLLLRTICSEQAVQEDLLRSLVDGLLEDLRAVKQPSSPRQELAGIIRAFAAIDVKIKLEGSLPAVKPIEGLFVAAIKESVFNAVRHGFATEIYVVLDFIDGKHCLRVTNNGHAPYGRIVEGGGIGGIRKQLQPYGGTLTVRQQPRFVLEIDLPGGEYDVHGADCRRS